MGRQCDRAAAAMAQVPLTYHQDVLTILPAPLDRSILPDRLAQTDAAVIIKLGRHFEKVRSVLNELVLTERSLYIERATLPEQQIRAIDQVNPAAVPYWSPILIPSRSHPGA
jgi:precorrin-2/cobalt-factor-2 C20-methyltransferase